MSREGMVRLEANVRAMVMGAEGDPEIVKTVLATEMRATRLLLPGAWEELAQIGSEQRHRGPGEVEWARGLVNESLLRLGLRADERWRNLMAVAQGIVDVMAREIQSYHQRHDGDARP